MYVSYPSAATSGGVDRVQIEAGDVQGPKFNCFVSGQFECVTQWRGPPPSRRRRAPATRARWPPGPAARGPPVSLRCPGPSPEAPGPHLRHPKQHALGPTARGRVGPQRPPIEVELVSRRRPVTFVRRMARRRGCLPLPVRHSPASGRSTGRDWRFLEQRECYRKRGVSAKTCQLAFRFRVQAHPSTP